MLCFSFVFFAGLGREERARKDPKSVENLSQIHPKWVPGHPLGRLWSALGVLLEGTGGALAQGTKSGEFPVSFLDPPRVPFGSHLGPFSIKNAFKNRC